MNDGAEEPHVAPARREPAEQLEELGLEDVAPMRREADDAGVWEGIVAYFDGLASRS